MTAGALSDSYQHCRVLHRRYGRTYYLATHLLPAWKRRHVHALYGFARYADEIVDQFDGATPASRAARLEAWAATFRAGLDGAPVDDPVLPAVLHTIGVFRLDRSDFTLFLRSMAMDLTVRSYPTYHDLLDYMEGSAAVIGAMMLPILGTGNLAAALDPARELGRAFQLTNFIRDIGEDVRRDRVYLPQADLDGYGVSRADLDAAIATGTAGEPLRRLIAFEVDRARAHYRAAAVGIPLLDPASQGCIRAAFLLYRGILDEIERAGYDVFQRRIVVPRRRRAAVVARCMLAGRFVG